MYFDGFGFFDVFLIIFGAAASKANVVWIHYLSGLKDISHKGKRIKIHEEKKQEKFFFKNLHRIGYRYFSVSKKTKKLVTKAFQKHFVQKNISGKIDQKTLKISHFLASRPI